MLPPCDSPKSAPGRGATALKVSATTLTGCPHRKLERLGEANLQEPPNRTDQFGRTSVSRIEKLYECSHQTSRRCFHTQSVRSPQTKGGQGALTFDKILPHHSFPWNNSRFGELTPRSWRECNFLRRH